MRSILLTLALVVGSVVAIGASPPAVADVVSGGGDFVRFEHEAKLLDTRDGTGAGGSTRKLGAGQSIVVQARGAAGIPSGAAALLVDITAIAPTEATALAVYAGDDPTGPTMSSLRVPKTTARLSNSVVVSISQDGKIGVANDEGDVHVVVDVQGYYTSATSAGGPGGLHPVTPARVLDTAKGIGAPVAKLAANGSVRVNFTGAVPAGADSVYLTVLALNAEAPGWLQAFPGTTRPPSTIADSVLDYLTDDTDSAASVKLADGVATFVNKGTAKTHLLLTVLGYTMPAPNTGAGYRPARVRLIDQFVAANATVDVQIAGRPGVATRGVVAAALNLGITGATQDGFLQAWPAGVSDDPRYSVLNHDLTSRRSLTFVRVGADGNVTIKNNSEAQARIFVDLLGWFTDQNPRVAPVQFAPVTGVQLSPVDTRAGAIEYAYVDNVGRLLVGHQEFVDNFSVTWTVVSTTGDLFSGQPNLTPLPDKTVQVTAEYVNTGVRAKVGTQTPGQLPTWTPAFSDFGGSFAAPPVVGTMPDGTPVAFAVDGDGRLWGRQQSDTPAYWRRMGAGNLAGTPAVMTIATGVRVFATTIDGTVVTATYDGGLSNWTSLGGNGIVDRPAVAVKPGYMAQLVVRLGDGTIATKAQAPDGSFPPEWTVLGGLTGRGAPAAVFDQQTGRVEFLARGAGDWIYNTGETLQGSGVWRDWIAATGEPSATDPTMSALTGTANGYGWFAPYRTATNEVRVITPNVTQFATHDLAVPK